MKKVKFQYPDKSSINKEIGIIIDGICVFLTLNELKQVLDAAEYRENEITFNDDWIGITSEQIYKKQKTSK